VPRGRSHQPQLGRFEWRANSITHPGPPRARDFRRIPILSVARRGHLIDSADYHGRRISRLGPIGLRRGEDRARLHMFAV
jgi:hypothetical protein